MKVKNQYSNLHYYFAYGSNLLMSQMMERCPNSTPLAKAMLRNHKLNFKSNKSGNGVATVEYSHNDIVLGAVYEITDNDLKKLDRFEGYPFIYERKNLVVDTPDGPLIAIVYVMKEEFEFKKPNLQYFSKIYNGYKDWKLNSNLLLQLQKSLKIGFEQTV